MRTCLVVGLGKKGPSEIHYKKKLVRHSMKNKQIANPQYWPENQQLGPKIVKDDSPRLNSPFPTIFGEFPNKIP